MVIEITPRNLTSPKAQKSEREMLLPLIGAMISAAVFSYIGLSINSQVNFVRLESIWNAQTSGAPALNAQTSTNSSPTEQFEPSADLPTDPAALGTYLVSGLDAKSPTSLQPASTGAVGAVSAPQYYLAKNRPVAPKVKTISPIVTPSGPELTASCNDCKYFPVNKKWTLSSSYIPANLTAVNLPGGGELTKATLGAMTELFSAANAQGLKPKVNSAYRSFAKQQETFNYWYQGELRKGITPLKAEQNANRYSAKPGHSEHQLGTTADISCANASGFDRTSQCNNAIWAFIKDNAHRYGFVISYPQGKEGITGYVYEPWHIRFVGVELATELHTRGYLGSNGWYLTKFLQEKNLY